MITIGQGDHNHLFIRQGTGLQGQAVFRTKLTFRPHSTDSFTHRKMTLSLADRSQKTSAIKILGTVGADPEVRFALVDLSIQGLDTVLLGLPSYDTARVGTMMTRHLCCAAIARRTATS